MEENEKCTVEALILASPEPVSVQRLCEVIGKISPRDVRDAVDDLNNLYMGCGNSFRIREVAGGYQMYILPDFEGVVKKLLEKQRTVRLTRAALETLAIVAYKQPVTKSEIEHIRGVASDGVLHSMLQRDLIAIAGRADGPGRPLLYRTSKEFLKFFGLNRLSDLPRMEEIEEMIRQSEPAENQTVFQFSENQSRIISGPSGNGDDSDFESELDDEPMVLANIETEKAVTLETVLADHSDNGNGGNGDLRRSTSILDNYEPIPGDPVPELNPLKTYSDDPATDESSELEITRPETRSETSDN